MKPLGHWAMVFETHDGHRPGCFAHDEDPGRCSCASGCDRCQGTGFLPCEAPTQAYVGSRSVCPPHFQAELRSIMFFRELFGLKEGEGLSLTPWRKERKRDDRDFHERILRRQAS